jgi:hypothetical protein
LRVIAVSAYCQVESRLDTICEPLRVQRSVTRPDNDEAAAGSGICSAHDACSG